MKTNKMMNKVEVLFFGLFLNDLGCYFNVYTYLFLSSLTGIYIFAGGETLRYWNNLFVKQRELKFA